MKSLFIHYIRRLVLKANLSWVLGFLIFWSILSMLLINVYKPSNFREYALYISLGYSSTTLIALSTFAIGIAFAIFFNAQALPFMFKFSKLTPLKYIIAFYSANLLDAEIISIFSILVFIILTKLNGNVVLPSNPGLLIVGIFFEGLFLISIAILIELFSLIKIKMLQYSLFLLYIPMFIAIASYFLYTVYPYSNPILDYANPFLSSMLLTVYSYYGHSLPISARDYNSTLSIPYLFLGILPWVLVLTVVDILLLRKIYLRQAEEQRMF
ncbi:ABC transporter permease [Sulfolobus sp. S-194]|uniref:ABC transporter permease n=1 Tax=Sulfolobus sp. S-194 TaxID=2512240 RepID=UPI001436EF3A|nr:ABC transporter permease [Sulfolobus sp. S-194]QIW23854.1 ABC transporter permease [Sulfolobus sp. S-194]